MKLASRVFILAYDLNAVSHHSDGGCDGNRVPDF